MSLPIAILAGGLATRLGHITRQTPKSLLEVAGKPFVEHQLDLLRHQGFRHVVFCVGHLGELVEEILGNGSRSGMRFSYSYDGPVLLGTGGALRQALPLLGEVFFLLYGDSYLECDYLAVEERFLSSGKGGLMTVYRNMNQWDRSNIVFLNGSILQYDKKERTPEMQYIDYGLGILRAAVVEEYPSGKYLDLATIYQDLVKKGELAGFEIKERFYEIGSPAGLEEIRSYLAQKKKRGERKDDLY